VLTADLLGRSVVALVFGVVVVAIIMWQFKKVRLRKALEQIPERYDSGLALVRYVMLNRQCSEEVAYKRLATFVKNHVPLDDHSSIERMLAQDRQSLLEHAQSLLVHDPDEIDKI
jgi:hypothetical protein